MSETITQFSIDIAVALIILSVGIWLAKKLKTISVNLMSKKGLDPLLANFAGGLAHILLVIVVVIASLSQLGIQTTSLIAILGAAGL
ncbi:MAG: mechanosensitive ion channel family protein, partial [Pseudohongiellaceae bacterium]